MIKVCEIFNSGNDIYVFDREITRNVILAKSKIFWRSQVLYPQNQMFLSYYLKKIWGFGDTYCCHKIMHYNITKMD